MALTEALQEGSLFGLWFCSWWRWRDLFKSTGLCCQPELQSRRRKRYLTQTRREGDPTHTHTQVRHFCLVHVPVKGSSEPRLVLRPLALFLEKLKLYIVGAQYGQTQRNDCNKLCDSPLPHLERELRDMRVRSQSCWNKYSDMHRCRAHTFVCTGWELLNSNLKAMDFPFLTGLHWFEARQVRAKGCERLRCHSHYSADTRDEYKLRAFGDDKPLFSQLSVSLPFWGITDGWQAWATAIHKSCAMLKKKLQYVLFGDFKTLSCPLMKALWRHFV